MDRKRSTVTIIISMFLVASLPYSKADSCVGKSMGWKYQDPEDCHGFFVCYMERSYQAYCDHAEKFDVASQKCVPGKCPPCSCNSAPLPTDPIPTEPSVPEPDRKCISSPDCSIAAEGSFHRDIQDCRKYYVCIALQPVTNYCPPGLYFDEVRFVCLDESLVACTPNKNANCSTVMPTTTPCPTPSTTPVPTTPTTPCPTPSPTTPTTPCPTPSPTTPTTPAPTPSPTPVPTPSPTPCPIPSPTPVPTPSPTPCPTPSPTPVPTPSPTTDSTPSPTPCPTSSPTTVPTPSPTPCPTSSPTTVTTSSPTPAPGTTPEIENGEVDPNIKDCLNRPNGSFIRNTEHCNIYYVCRDGDAVKHRCAIRQWFDDVHFVCNFREYVNCPARQD